eukprot:UN00921
MSSPAHYLVYLYIYCQLAHYTLLPSKAPGFSIPMPSTLCSFVLTTPQKETISLTRAVKEMMFFAMHAVSFDIIRVLQEAPTFNIFFHYYNFNNTMFYRL